jgi:cytochrome d ubiquinol oxidase subunit II
MYANVAGSVGAPFLWGVALANLLYGVPLASGGAFAGSSADLISPYTVFAGIATVLLFAFHGATFLTLRTDGELGARAGRAARVLAVPAAAVLAAFLVLTVVVAVDRNDRSALWPALAAGAGIAAVVLAAASVRLRRSGWAFVMTAIATVLAIATLFIGLYPRVVVAAPGSGSSLTVSQAASAHYTLAVITVVAVVVTPVVVLYQAWTYHVFRARLSGGDATPEPAAPPAPRPGV